MPKRVPSELSPELVSTSGMNSFMHHVSASRLAMFTSHLGQFLIMKGATPPRIMTGMEREYGKYTFSIKMPCNAQVIKRIDRYRETLSGNSIKENPETTIIYENADTGEIGILPLIRYHTLDKKFGFRYKFKKAEAKLKPKAYIPKDTIVADSPAVADNGEYMYGVEANVIFMSIPQIIEDGVVVRRGFLEKMSTKGMEPRTVSWGENRYPINLYGDDKHYKPFPDIGERVREDGLLFALREYDELLGPVDMTPAALRTPDFYYDKLIYAPPGAKVIDVSVYHDANAPYKPTPVGMSEQPEKYRKARSQYYSEILSEYWRLKKERGSGLKLSRDFHRLLVEAMSDSSEVRVAGKKERVVRTYRRSPLDEWRVEVMLEYDFVPTIGSKLTDIFGGKGVIVDIWEDEDCPVDDRGNRADFIMDGDSTIKRMNIGRLYGHYIPASARDTVIRLKDMIGSGSPAEIEQAWQYLLGFYKITAPQMYDVLTSDSYTKSPMEHLRTVIENGIYLRLPSDNPVLYADVVRELRKHYPAFKSQITYRGRSGNVVRTRDEMLVGSMYIMLLEKTGGDWSGVSSSKLQHFGIPAKLTNADKYSAPGRQTPVRIMGEAEVRLQLAVVGLLIVADIVDQSNNPRVHKEIVRNIITAEQPTNIERVIDRKKYPIGHGRTLTFMHHMMECAGVRMVVPSNITRLHQE